MVTEGKCFHPVTDHLVAVPLQFGGPCIIKPNIKATRLLIWRGEAPPIYQGILIHNKVVTMLTVVTSGHWSHLVPGHTWSHIVLGNWSYLVTGNTLSYLVTKAMTR